MKAGGLDGGVSLSESVGGNGVLLGDLIKGFPLLHRVGRSRIVGNCGGEEEDGGGESHVGVVG